MAGINILGVLAEHRRSNGTIQTGYAVYGTDGASPTMLARAEGGRILIAEKTVKVIGQMNVEQQKKQDCKVVGELGEKKSNGGTQYYQQDRVYHGDIQPAQLPGGSYNFLLEEAKKYRIRKLTPRECWRLMGYTDGDFDKAASVNSNSQLYKESGNAIVKQVLMAIFLQLNIQGKRNWNDRNKNEIKELIHDKRNYNK